MGEGSCLLHRMGRCRSRAHLHRSTHPVGGVGREAQFSCRLRGGTLDSKGRKMMRRFTYRCVFPLDAAIGPWSIPLLATCTFLSSLLTNILPFLPTTSRHAQDGVDPSLALLAAGCIPTFPQPPSSPPPFSPSGGFTSPIPVYSPPPPTRQDLTWGTPSYAPSASDVPNTARIRPPPSPVAGTYVPKEPIRSQTDNTEAGRGSGGGEGGLRSKASLQIYATPPPNRPLPPPPPRSPTSRTSSTQGGSVSGQILPQGGSGSRAVNVGVGRSGGKEVLYRDINSFGNPSTQKVILGARSLAHPGEVVLMVTDPTPDVTPRS